MWVAVEDRIQGLGILQSSNRRVLGAARGSMAENILLPYIAMNYVLFFIF
jgi:hypothetical protein